VANQVEQQKTPAGPPHVANEPAQVAFAEVMTKIHAEGYIGRRKSIGNAVGGDDQRRRVGYRRQLHIDTDRFNPKSALNLLQNSTVSAANIEHSAHRQRILSNGGNNRPCIPKVSMNTRELVVSARHLRFRDSVAFQEFRLNGPLHAPRHGFVTILSGRTAAHLYRR
jgi:hypothetical protein